MNLSEATRQKLVQVAHRALTGALVSSDQSDLPPAEGEMLQPAGCFVSLHECDTHRLRGCVGRLDAQQSLWETVYYTAGEALRDPRFVNDRVTAQELERLELEISVLSTPREAESPMDFEPLRDGIYLLFAGRAGFFLPQVARETGWTKEQLLDRLCSEKLGLHPRVWERPGAKLYTFQVEVIGPEAVLPAGENERSED